MSSRVRYEEVECRTALNRVKGMGFRWSLNPYRGCVHGCHYCFARRFHSYYDLDTSNDFTSVIFVKTNAHEVLAQELSRRSWRREVVTVGTATDPYQPIEGKYRVTRRCLEAFVDWRSPITLITKGSMIIRDVDVLQELARRAECTVCFSITTMDPQLVRKLEPGTPPPHQRLRAMGRLVQAGVNAGVALAPVIPGITDDTANLENVARSAADHGARFLWANTVYLKPGTKEHFLSFVRKEYPGLEADFQRLYPGSYAPKSVQSDLDRRIADIKLAHGLSASEDGPTDEDKKPRQLKLTLE